MNTQSEWLDIMLSEIARKRDEAADAAAEQALRAAAPPQAVPADKQPQKG
ncbi:MAG: hypothetical protein NT064_05105 [Proteobacteria bacterium]|jgi:hypothetical protein|nr:hypothetical protein [Pseudomonadota bacterium]